MGTETRSALRALCRVRHAALSAVLGGSRHHGRVHKDRTATRSHADSTLPSQHSLA